MTLSRHLPSSLHQAQYRHENRPLIESVTNAWRHSEKHPTDSSADEDDDDDDYSELQHCCDLDSDASFITFLRAIVASRKFRRVMIASILVFVAFVFLSSAFFMPAWRQRQELLKGLDDTNSFGHETPDKFEDIVQLQQLPAEYIPGGVADPDGKRRLIFIGDIHGCKDELLHLLKLVKFDKKLDKIIATGDVVAKGPDSPGVVDTLISVDALSVRGNHEDRILLAAKSYLQAGDTLEPTDEVSEESSATSKGAGLKGEALLPYFKHHHFTYLKSLPLIIHIPAIKPPSHPAPQLASHKKSHKKRHFLVQHDIEVVHAGLVPSVPLLRQDPFSVMNMRSMSPSTHVPSENRKKGIPWERVWGWYNDRINRTRSTFLSWLFGQATESKEASQWWESWNRVYGGEDSPTVTKHRKPSVVVYGHDSPRGLNLKPWSKGLDGGCVGGGELNAMVLNAWGQAEIVSSDCKHRK